MLTLTHPLALSLLTAAVALCFGATAAADTRVEIQKDAVTVPLSVAMVELEAIIDALGEDHPVGEGAAALRVRLGGLRERVRRGVGNEARLLQQKTQAEARRLKAAATQLAATLPDALEPALLPEVERRLKRAIVRLAEVDAALEAAKPPPPYRPPEGLTPTCGNCPKSPPTGAARCAKGRRLCTCIYHLSPNTSCMLACTCQSGRWSCIPSPCRPTPDEVKP